MHVGEAGGRIYWANYGGSTISFANLDGSGGGGNLSTTGATALDHPSGLAIDPAAGRIYWANYSANKISYANVNGTGGGGDLTTTGVTPDNPGWPVVLNVPSGAGVPVVSGGSVPGSTLACSQGTWTPDLLSDFDYLAPQSFTFAWKENGIPVGATLSSITAGSAGIRLTSAGKELLKRSKRLTLTARRARRRKRHKRVIDRSAADPTGNRPHRVSLLISSR